MSIKKIKFILMQLISIALFTQGYAAEKMLPADTAIVKIVSRDSVRHPVRLVYTENEEAQFMLKAESVNGVYEFRIPVKEYSRVNLYIASEQSIIQSGNSFIPQPAPQFLIKGGQEVAVSVDFNNPLDLVLTSADREILLYESYAQKEREISLQIWAQMKIKYASPDQQETVAKAEAEIARLSAALRVAKSDFVDKNRHSFAALMVFESYYAGLDNEKALKLLQSIAGSYHNHSVWRVLYSKLNSASLTMEGAVIPAFQAEDINGKLFSSNKLNGKYLLIDFWGSWCQPCRISHPALKELYEKYRSKGLEILGVAYESGSLKNQRTQWKKAIEEDQIHWIHVLNSEENNIVKMFGVTSYPTKILVDPKGTILARISGKSDELEKLLKEIFE